MTDVMRDMIAQLMGSQKEGEEGRDLPPYHHPSVCRAYLIGCCPYELVPDSRLQGLVSCRKTHEPAHKADFLKAQKERDHYYDVDAFDILENAIRIVDNEISRIKDKLDREAREQTDTAEAVKTQRINDLSEQIGKAVAEMEELGNMGKVEESMKLSKTVEDLRARKAELEGQTDFRLAGPGSNAARLRVCEDCGAQLNIMDHESRIADHFGGKMHLGMVECREKYAEMKVSFRVDLHAQTAYSVPLYVHCNRQTLELLHSICIPFVELSRFGFVVWNHEEAYIFLSGNDFALHSKAPSHTRIVFEISVLDESPVTADQHRIRFLIHYLQNRNCLSCVASNGVHGAETLHLEQDGGAKEGLQSFRTLYSIAGNA
ncbi:hypothetical protein Y032_0134g1819 [Ancylostoma ceylanicum]|uniref:LUC7 protein n=2 Tax=Ancylostoma ceylanicum TaxID=53326 RepID=A0A016T5W3_9BILA|nr:hypothetical protein Y032_0134g1819 [Ancylostoma ceylanicum]